MLNRIKNIECFNPKYSLLFPNPGFSTKIKAFFV